MGILGNLFMAGAVHHHNNRRNGISRRLFGAVPDSGNVVICGGDSTSNDTFSYEIKADSLVDTIMQSATKRKPTLCFYSDDSLTPIIMDLMKDNNIKDNLCIFGHTYSYIPFDKNVDHFKAEQMMDELVASYNHKNNSFGTAVQTIMSILLNVLSDYFPNDYYTYSNLANIIEHLVNSKGEDDFLDWFSSITSADVDPFENKLTIEWNTAITEFNNFWGKVDSEVRTFQKAGLRKRSLFSCLLENKVCIFKLSSNYNRNIVELLLNELAIFKDCSRDYTIINYNVNMSAVSKYELLDAGRSILIGNTLQSIGMKDYNPPRASFVSLGIASEEAAEIFNKMVATGWWTQVSMGFGRHNHVEFAPKHQEPIPPNVLVSIRDGSAYIINPQGYEQVDIMF